MSIKKLAKAINNLADAITYHADSQSGRPSASVTDFLPGMSMGKMGPYKGNPQNVLKSDCDGFATSPDIESKVYAAEGFKMAADSGPDTPSHAVDTVTGASITEQIAERAREVDFSDDLAIDNSEAYVDPYDAPGWQTLTVADLKESPLSEDHGVLVDLDTEEAEIKALKERNNPPAPPVDNPPAPPVDNLPPAPAPVAPPAPVISDTPVDNPPVTPSEKGAEPSEYDVLPADNSVEVDSAGLPWDERIHSGGKTKLADGTWRDKRGVDNSEREAIVAELTKVMAIPVPPAEDWGQLAAETKENAPAPASIKTLPEFVRAVTGAKLGNMMVTEAVKSVGLESITQLGARPDLIPAVAAELGL